VRYAYPVTTSSPWREFRLLPPFLPDATAPDTRAQRQAPAARQD
jgi:hypothetical protein